MYITNNNIKYGIEKFGRLKSALMHCPQEAIKIVTEDNKEYFLFDAVPDVDKYLQEHCNYQKLLKDNGVKVHLVAENVSKNIDLLNRLPNIAYMHDIAVISSHGSIISKMSSRGRCHEEIVVSEALSNLGIPKLYEPSEGEDFEGCLLLSPKTVFVADTERHSPESIEKFIKFILENDYFDEIIYAQIPQERRFMHPDMVLNRITENLMIYYPPAFLKTFFITKEIRKEIDLKTFMNSRKIEMVSLSDKEQKKWGSSFVPLEPGIIINYDISLEQTTINTLVGEGVKFIHFHPDALLAGGGSLRCLTLRLLRE
ncbi:MAG: N-dimethylarginine dimethylaminohydrolase [Clostridia bacterium]|nr:N-dimethylarginine dimethylaminohydrolase [Clostridia bacterium]